MMRSRWVWAAAAGVLVALAVVTLQVVRRDDGSAPSGAPPTTTPTTTASASASASAIPPATTAPTSPEPAPPTVPGDLRGLDVEVLPTTRPVVALTFDAGANGAGLGSILATLSDAGVPATFFLTGRWAEANPAGVASIVAAGHRVGNHSVSHPHVPELSDAALADEVLGAEQQIRGAGADPRPLFRFPYGDRDARTIAAVNDLGYVAVRWTVDTLGWKGTSGGLDAQQVTDRVLAGLRPGEIVLMHVGSNPDDGTTLDADALPGMIGRLRAAGYGFVTLDALLGA
jgi:peptidoglycan/xylan/chitin deacetylase (PgdA/CDA1 family)